MDNNDTKTSDKLFTFILNKLSELHLKYIDLFAGISNTNATKKYNDRVLEIYEAIERISSDTRRTLDEQAMRELDPINDKDFNSKIH